MGSKGLTFSDTNHFVHKVVVPLDLSLVAFHLNWQKRYFELNSISYGN